MIRSTLLLLALLMSVHTAAASSTQRDEALAWLNNPFIKKLQNPIASNTGKSRPSGLQKRIFSFTIGPIGAARDTLSQLGYTDDVIAVNILLARVWRINEETARAHTLALKTLAQAEATGWNDARLSGLLQDLALFSAEADTPEQAEAYRLRASVCPRPCREDGVFQLIGKAEQAFQHQTRRNVRHFEQAKLAFFEQTYGRDSSLFIDKLGSAAAALEDTRPWLAMDYRLRQIEAKTARGDPKLELLISQLSMAKLLLDAGEYARLGSYSDQMLNKLKQLPANQTEQQDYLLAETYRVRARGRRQINAPDTPEAYKEAVEILFQVGGRDRAKKLLLDLLDTSHLDLARQVAEALHHTPDWQTTSALARIAQRQGQHEEAIRLTQGLIDELNSGAQQGFIDAWVMNLAKKNRLLIDEESRQKARALLENAFKVQLAAYQVAAGRPDTGAMIRQTTACPEADTFRDGLWVNGSIGEIRDFGAFDAAGFLARGMLDNAGKWQARKHYDDAQSLWQLAYTLSRAGLHQLAFPLMQQAADIASQHSYANIESSEGGSMELMKRDKWRYLLFVDIAWGASSGENPQDMTVLSRY